MWRSVRTPVCPPACPTNSSSHFCPKNTTMTGKNILLTLSKHLKNTQTSSSWRILSRLFRSCSAGFLVLHSSLSLRRRCLALCERPTAENWQTTAAAIMRQLCVKGAIVNADHLSSFWKAALLKKKVKHILVILVSSQLWHKYDF